MSNNVLSNNDPKIKKVLAKTKANVTVTNQDCEKNPKTKPKTKAKAKSKSLLMENITVENIAVVNQDSGKKPKIKAKSKVKSKINTKDKLTTILNQNREQIPESFPIHSETETETEIILTNTLSNYGYQIPKSTLTPQKIAKIKADLTVMPKINLDYGETPESFPVYIETKNCIKVPRYYGTKHYGKPVMKFETKNSKVDFEFTGKLRGTQPEVAKYILDGIINNGGGLLQLHTGYGKTTLALYLASVLKLKTLVIVHKTFLQDQWYDRIKQFTTASIGIIRQKKVDTDNKDIVIGMLQSISMIDYDPEIFKDFDLVICDECFPGYTKIMTDIGSFAIEDLYKLWENGNDMPLIKSYNEKTKCFEFKKMTYAWKKQTDLLVKIKLGNKIIECTPNHKFLTTNGYKEANILTNDDILIGTYDDQLSENIFSKALNDDQMQIVLGSFIGNGNIDIKDNRYRLRMKYDIDKKEYYEWKSLMFNDETTFLGETNEFQTQSFDINGIFPQSKTFCPQWVIDKLDFRGIAIWIMDNCLIDAISSQIIISRCTFDNTEQIINCLVKKLNDLEIACNYQYNKGNYHINMNEQMEVFISKIYPYIHKSMKNEINIHKFSCDGISKMNYEWNNKYLDYGTCRLTSIVNVDINEINEINKTVYDIEVENNHNFIVGDESNNCGLVVHNCHHMASKVFSRALLKIFPKYTIGLSATPNRNDGLTKVIKWFLGETIVKVERKGDNAVYIKSFAYKSNDKLFDEKKRWIKGKGSKPDTVKMITNMHKINSRNDFVANIINSLRQQDERKTLILSGRIEHLKVLKTLVDAMITEDINNGICSPDEFKTAFYIGGMKEYELKDSSEADLIFATYSMAEEGLDIDGLNTLVLATPKKDIIQSIGRIMRKPIEEGDINPLIIDIIDDLSCFKNWGDQRLKYYKSKQYTISNFKAFNKDVIPFKNYMVNEGMITKQDSMKPDLDIRKEYILKKFGEITYNFESEIEFESFPSEMFDYNCEYNDMFKINHEYENKDNAQQIEITYCEDIEIEI